MPHSESSYEAILQRAWRSVYDALLYAETRNRRNHVRRLKHACVVLNECQADIADTAAALAGDRARADYRRLTDRAERA